MDPNQDSYSIDEAIDKINREIQPIFKFTSEHLLDEWDDEKIRFFAKDEHHSSATDVIKLLAGDDGYIRYCRTSLLECIEYNYVENNGCLDTVKEDCISDGLMFVFAKKNLELKDFLVSPLDLSFELNLAYDAGEGMIRAIQNSENETVYLSEIGFLKGENKLEEYLRVKVIKWFSVSDKEKLEKFFTSNGIDITLKKVLREVALTRRKWWARPLTMIPLPNILKSKVKMGLNPRPWEKDVVGKLVYKLAEFIVKAGYISKQHFMCDENGRELLIMWDCSTPKAKSSDVFIPKFELQRYMDALINPDIQEKLSDQIITNNKNMRELLKDVIVKMGLDPMNINLNKITQKEIYRHCRKEYPHAFAKGEFDSGFKAFCRGGKSTWYIAVKEGLIRAIN